MGLCFVDKDGKTLGDTEDSPYLPVGSEVRNNTTRELWRVTGHSYRFVEARGGYVVDFVEVEVISKAGNAQ